MEPLSDDDIVRMAKARVSFKVHLVIYVAANLLFAAIWWLSSSTKRPTFSDAPGADYYWPIWPMLGWGVGLMFHGLGAYGAGRGWEEREIEKLRERYARK